MSSQGSQFTCISCRVAFSGADLQRAHYKSDWHRYNLKRKVAELPPVDAAEFKQRVLAQQSKTAEAARDTSARCDLCGKHFRTGNAYTNHLQSKKHRELEAKAKSPTGADDGEDYVSTKNAKNRKEKAKVDAYEGEKMIREGAEKLKGREKKELDNMAAEAASASSKKDVASSSSKKDVASSSSKKDVASSASASFMQRVPRNAGDKVDDEDEEMEDDEWDDIEGEEIATTDCLFCAHSAASVEENLNHMTVSHSFFLPNIEYLVDMEGMLTHLGIKVGCDFMCLWCNDKGKAFFSLDAVQRHMKDKGHCKLLYEGDAIYEYADFYDFRKSYPDFDERNGGAVGGAAEDDDEEDEEEIDVGSLDINQDGFELMLPSGMRIGHRELSRYYRQNLPLERRVVKRNPALIGRLMTQYRALGWHGNTGEASKKKIRDLRYVQKFRDRQRLKLQTKANKLQRHFRLENPV